MEFTVLAALGGFGFVLLALAVNVAYLRTGLPRPTAGLPAVTEAYAAIGDGLRKPSMLAPLGWVCTTVFAAGLLATRGSTGWALVGFAGVLLQNATFAAVEALRFGLVAAAPHGHAAMAGLHGTSTVLFGFNQVFLALALLGFTAAGTGLIPGWHAALGYVSAALLFLSSSASPRTDRLAPAGLIGWLGWIAWIVAYSVTLLRWS